MKIDKIKASLSPLLVKANIPYALLGIVFLALVVYIGSTVSQNMSVIEAWFSSIGYWAIVAFALMFIVLTSFLVPESILSITAGALFGFKLGIVVAMSSMILASVFQFWLARHLLRKPINKALQAKPKFLAIQKAVMKDEFRLQVLLRLTPLNPTIISYMLGAAGVKLNGFIISCFAMLPLISAEVYFGVIGKRTVEASGSENVASALQNVILVVGIIMCVVVIYLVSKAARKAVDQASLEIESEPVSSDNISP